MLHCHVDIICDIVGCDRPVLRDLVNHVMPSVANHWYDLGLQLLDPKYENELNIIEAADMKNDYKTCCRKMFSKWLNTDKLASWDKVIKALTLIGLDNVASNIKQLLGLQGEPIYIMTQQLAMLLLCSYQSISVLCIPLDSRARLCRGNQKCSLVTFAYFP